MLDLLRQRQRAQEVAEIVGERVELQANRIGASGPEWKKVPKFIAEPERSCARPDRAAEKYSRPATQMTAAVELVELPRLGLPRP